MYEDIIQPLRDGHRTMRHVLTLLRAQLDMLHPDAGAQPVGLLKNAVGYMHNFPGLIHHPVEELIFERLIRHAPHTEPLCAHLVKQHATFKRQEEEMLDHLRAAGNPGDGVHARLKEIGVHYCMDHADHIDGEESKTLPEAIKWLHARDWQAIREKCRFDIDPLSNPATLARHDSLYDYLMTGTTNFSRH